MNTPEVWKPVTGFEDRYEVSTLGRVKSSTERFRQKNKGFLSTDCIGSSGYVIIVLAKDGKKVSKTAHRLVAEAFIPNPLGLPCVNHKNGIRNDNRAENLEWCTYRDNFKHSVNTGTAKGLHKGRYFTKLSEDDILTLALAASAGMRTSDLARLFCVGTPYVSSIKAGRLHKELVRRVEFVE